jgi:hypothetical protein
LPRKTPACIRQLSLPRRGIPPRFHLKPPPRASTAGGLKPCGLENGVLLRKTPACIRHPSFPRRGKGRPFPVRRPRLASMADGCLWRDCSLLWGHCDYG